MAYDIDGADPLEEVVSEMERVYGVRLQIVSEDGFGGGRDDEFDIGGRGKQDRT